MCESLLMLSYLLLILVIFDLFNSSKHLQKTGNGFVAMGPNSMTSIIN